MALTLNEKCIDINSIAILKLTNIVPITNNRMNGPLNATKIINDNNII